MDDELSRRSAARVGARLEDKWRLDALLGLGGVAAVYAATHHNGTRAAIKILHGIYASDPEIRGRFLSEGYAANTVGHTAVVHVLDDDRTDDGTVFLVMELLEGETLRDRAARLGGALPAGEVLAAASVVLDVLVTAHEKNIVHRDLKPDNVFVTTEGAIRVLDFGLARGGAFLSTTPPDPPLGWRMGTPGFMSPEQARGQWDQVDARSDVWAVGATMFTLLSGRRVHEGSDPIERARGATRPVVSVASAAPSVPAAVAAIIDRALLLDRGARWQSALAMKDAVDAALADVLMAKP